MNPINYELEKDLAKRWIELLHKERDEQRRKQLRRFRTTNLVVLRPTTKPLNCRNGNGEEVLHV